MRRRIGQLTAVSVVALALFALRPAEAIIYSEEGHTTVAAWMWDPVVYPTRVMITMAELGLQNGDDVDGLSLGDDTPKFNKRRRDLFAVAQGTVGLAPSHVFNRAAAGKAVERDIYRDSRAIGNILHFKDIISMSTGGGAADGAIDAFDVGWMDQQKWVYFSLTPGSPTLTAMGWGPSDVLACQYGNGATLKLYCAASNIGNPADIDALSIYDDTDDAVYDPANDYIIYSNHTAGDGFLYHYGLGGPPGAVAHDHPTFGLLDTDNIYALEHILIKIRIEGTVTDRKTGEPLELVKVKAKLKGGSDKDRTVTDMDGSYFLADLVDGRWKLKYRLKGYKPHQTTIRLRDGEAVEYDVELRPKK